MLVSEESTVLFFEVRRKRDLKYHCVHKYPAEPDFFGPNWHQEQMQLLPWAEVFRNDFVYNSLNYLDQAAQAFSHICT